MTVKGPIGYSGGLNTKSGAYTLGQDQMPASQNVQIIGGTLKKRKGSAVINATAFASSAVVHGLADWQTAAGQRYNVITAGTKIGQMADLGGTYTDITGSVTITSGQNNQSTWASLNNILVRCGGTTPDAPIQWTGTGNASALSGTPPTGNICTVVNNFMFISGVAATPSRVFWSNVGDPQTWTAANFADFRLSDGDKVTALCPLGQNLAIFKRRSIGTLYTTPPTSSLSVTLGPLTTATTSYGCVGAQAVDTLPDGSIVFLGSNAHLYLFDGAQVEDISDREQQQSAIQPNLDALNVGRLQYAVVRVYPTKNQILVSVSTGTNTTNDTIYCYNYLLGVWESPYIGIAANVLCPSIDTRNTASHPIIMLTGNYSGTVYEQDKGNVNPEDVNNNIDGYGTVSVQIGAEDREFIPRSLIVPVESLGNYNLQVNYGFDGVTATPYTKLVSLTNSGGIMGQFIMGSSTLGVTTPNRKIVPLVNKGNCSSIQVQFRTINGGQDFTIHPFYISDEVAI